MTYSDPFPNIYKLLHIYKYGGKQCQDKDQLIINHNVIDINIFK